MLLEIMMAVSNISVKYDEFKNQTTVISTPFVIANKETHPEDVVGDEHEILMGFNQTIEGKDYDNFTEDDKINLWIGVWGRTRNLGRIENLYILADGKRFILQQGNESIWISGKQIYTFPSGFQVKYDRYLIAYTISLRNLTTISESTNVRIQWDDIEITLSKSHRTRMSEFINFITSSGD